MRGFLIYALGHRNYYQMAEVLAASLVVNNAAAKATLVCSDKTKLRYPRLFDQVLTVDETVYMQNGKLVFNHATICMYEHSPYDETIKLDADMVWISGRDPLQLFEDLKPYDLMLENRGHGWNKGNSVWAEEADLQKAYGFTEADKLYKIYGEFVYFKRNAIARKFFAAVKKAYHKPKVKCAAFSNGTFTDELAYQIAVMQLGIDLIDNFTPVNNSFLGLNQYNGYHPYQLPKSFYAYSIGGNSTAPWRKQQYNLLAAHYFYQLGLANPYQVKDKKTFLPERQKL